jgi:hypothetical protein
MLSLLLTLIPSIASLFAGPTAGAIAAQVGSIVTSVTGVADPHTDAGQAAAMIALTGKPELQAQLQAKIIDAHLEASRVQAEADKADADARTAQIVAAVASQASARTQTVDLVKAGSGIAWGAPVVSGLILLAFGGMLYVVMSKSIPTGSEPLAMVLLGTLAAMATQVANYWLGSSAGSAAKNTTISDAITGGVAPRPLS